MDSTSFSDVLIHSTNSPWNVGVCQSESTMRVYSGCHGTLIHWDFSKDGWICMECGIEYLHGVKYLNNWFKLSPNVGDHNYAAARSWISVWTGLDMDKIEMTVRF